MSDDIKYALLIGGIALAVIFLSGQGTTVKKAAAVVTGNSSDCGCEY